MSPAYANALEVSRIASQRYIWEVERFRLRIIGEVEFLAAQDEYKKSEIAFDAAYAEESKLHDD